MIDLVDESRLQRLEEICRMQDEAIMELKTTLHNVIMDLLARIEKLETEVGRARDENRRGYYTE